MSSDQYLRDLSSFVAKNHPLQRALSSAFCGQQRVYHSALSPSVSSTLSSILNAQKLHMTLYDPPAVCVIENISPEWIGALGTTWDIPHHFFVDYATNSDGPSLWTRIMGEMDVNAKSGFWDMLTAGSIPEFPKILPKKGINEYHIEGIFEHVKRDEFRHNQDRFQRIFQHDRHYGWQANTKISYLRVTEALYLFLVDTPFEVDGSDEHLLPPRLNLNVPYARNYSGLSISQLYEKSYFSAFDCLESWFSHGTVITRMCQELGSEGAVDPATLSYMLASSVWLTNIRWLENEIQTIAFKDIRKPTISTNNRLHDRRQDLKLLQKEVQMSCSWIEPVMDKHLESLRAVWSPSPKQAFEQVIKDAQDLERFLMDTFQLLMSSISVLDSQTSIQQAKRGSRLTVLATIYVPLSFVTGIYGMNIREINDSRLSIWVFVVTLVAVALGTIGLLWLVRQSQHDYSDPIGNPTRRKKCITLRRGKPEAGSQPQLNFSVHADEGGPRQS